MVGPINRILFCLLTAISCSTAIKVNNRNPAHVQYALPAGIGAVLWSGKYAKAPAGQELPAGLQVIADKGFNTVKIPIDPANINDHFGIHELSYTENSFLDVAVKASPIAAALANPGIHYYILSVFDAIVEGTQGKLRRFTDPIFLVAHKAEIIKAYRDFALTLIRHHQGSGKIFVISNWETENTIYSGGAYSFANNYAVTPERGSSFKFRDHCLATYQSQYGVPDPKSAFEAMSQWFAFRQQGVQEARAQALREGLSGVEVRSGIEFNSVHMIHDLGYPTVIYDLFPSHPSLFDEFAYSAYESINLGNLKSDLAIIKKQIGAHPLLISEFGFRRGGTYMFRGKSYSADQMMTNTAQQIAQFIKNGDLEAATVWQAFTDDRSSGGDMGLLDNSGNDTDLMKALLAGLEISNP